MIRDGRCYRSGTIADGQIDICWPGVVYSKGTVCRRGWEREQCNLSTPFDLAEQGEGLFGRIGTVTRENVRQGDFPSLML